MERQIADQLAALALPLLDARKGKDPRAVAQILKLAADNRLSRGDLSAETGLSAKTLRYYAQGRTSSGRRWPGGALARELKRLGLEVQERGRRTAAEPARPRQTVEPAPEVKSRTEVEDDGAIVVRTRPGDPGYTDLLRHLIGERGTAH